MKKILIIFGLFLISLGFASLTEEILGCFTLPVDGFLYLYGTNSHKAFEVMLHLSHYLIIAGTGIILGTLMMFPRIEGDMKFKLVSFRKWKEWKNKRAVVQIIVFFLIMAHVALVNVGVTKIPSICPLSFAEMASVGKYGLSAVFFALVFATVLLFGRGLCSWMCVYGPVQEHSAGLLKAFGVNPNSKKMKQFGLVYLLTAVFWGSLILSAYRYSGSLNFELSNGYQLAETWVFVGGLITFIPLTVLMTHLLGNRFFCKYLCPLGGTMSLYSKLGWLRVSIDSQGCDNCKICEETCPMDVDIHQKYVESGAKYIKDGNCIACGECVDQCPQGSLRLGFGTNCSFAPVVIEQEEIEKMDSAA